MLPVAWELLLLIVIANGAPVIAARVFGEWGAYPLDGGRVLADGHRLLGHSKTWRGILAATLATSVSAVLLGWPAQVGVTVGVTAMLGDVLSSFTKRRLGKASSSMALGLDQIPESLLPLLAVMETFDLSGSAVAWTVVGFTVLELALSPIFYWLGVRNRPY
ncbi:MAG: CDP-archaeol synthase [Candidatus Competibacteraceae bacterium]|jgi:CDP-diglyceride synthetase